MMSLFTGDKKIIPFSSAGFIVIMPPLSFMKQAYQAK